MGSKKGLIHVIGAGMAGLAAAVRLARAGWQVTLHEATPGAGGRCRSFEDAQLGCRIDNGNHLLMSANIAVQAFLREIGAGDALIGPENAAFPFVDLADGAQWTLRPNRGVVPWWIFAANRRIPGTRPIDYLSGFQVMLSDGEATMESRVPASHPLYRRFWEPLTLAALNTDPSTGSARLMASVLKETFVWGAARCRPLVARDGLGAAFIEPALATLAALGAEIRTAHRLRAFELEERRVLTLVFSEERITLGPNDRVVLAVPAPVAASLLPGLVVPEGAGRPILNAHFRLDHEIALPGGQPFLGIIGGEAHWLFQRGNLLSVTVSDARRLVDVGARDLARLLWRDVASAIGHPRMPEPPARIVKEQRATFVQTPENLPRRPPARTRWENLALAGDWTGTGIPATIEGAVRSGHTAAKQWLG